MDTNQFLKTLGVIGRITLNALANSKSPHVDHQLISNCQNVVKIGDEVAKSINSICKTLDTSYVIPNNYN